MSIFTQQSKIGRMKFYCENFYSAHFLHIQSAAKYSTAHYFRSKFDNDLKPILVAFRAARYFSPSKFYEVQPTVADIDCLRAFPFLDSQPIIDGLKAELPAYLAAAEDVSTEINAVAWWKHHTTELPKWAEAIDDIHTSCPTIFCCSKREYFQFCKALQLNNSHPWKTMLKYHSCYNTTVVQFTVMTQFM